MIRLVVAVIFLFWSLFAIAADWQIVADTKLGKLQLDKASVRADGQLTKAVLVYEFKDLQKLTGPNGAVFNKRQDEVLVNCAKPSLGILSSRFFEDDKLAGSFNSKAEQIKFKPSEAGTMIETVVLAVCTVISGEHKGSAAHVPAK